MTALRRIFARLAGFFGKRGNDAELREELEAHLDMETAENIRRGMAPEEARRRALISSGGMTQAAEAVRDQRSLPWLETAWADLRYALRSLRHSPAFTTVVVLTLALGIGANTAIFSVVRAVLLKPLPHRDGSHLVYFRQSSDLSNGTSISFSVPEIRDFRAGVPALGGIAEYSPFFGTLQGDEGSAQIDIGLVTGNFFEVMGLSPILGRLTLPSDDGTGVPPVMVLAHDFWIRHFGGDSAIVGKQVRLDGNSITVIGVLQPAPFFPNKVDALLNMVVSPHHLSALMITGRTHRMTEMVARLKPGATVEQVRAQVATTYARMQQESPKAYDAGSHYRVAVLPFKEAIGERAELTLWLLMAAAGFVLVITAANVINLTLMRGVRRGHELIVRAALGAGVGRLRRLLLVENLVLTVLAAGVGALLAVGGTGLLTSLAARYSPRASEIRLDGVVFGYALSLSVAVALLMAFVAALPREGTLSAWIAAGGRRLTGGVRKQRLQRGLVVAQIAVSVVLLAGAGLLTRTMIQLSNVNTGLRSEEVLTFPLPLLNLRQLTPGADAAAKVQYDRIRDELRTLPGVSEVGIGSTTPLRSSLLGFDMLVEGRAVQSGEAQPHADLRTANPEYFHAAGIPLLKGRNFDATDAPGAAAVVIVNQQLVDRYFPHDDPIGRRIAWTGDVLRFTPFTNEWRTIVGVVGNTQDGGQDAAPRAVAFQPWAQNLAISGVFVLRADSNAAGLIGAATGIARRLAPTAPIENVMTISQIKDQSVSPRRLNAQLISSFGLLALIIASIGIAGVLFFSVTARTNEIGIRMSLGADSAKVQRMVLREGGLLVGLGLLLGVIGAFFAVQVIRGLLFGVAPRDPVTFIVVAGLMAVIGILACWIPALRAARVDPTVAMRAN